MMNIKGNSYLEEVFNTNSSYCYPNSNTLVNKLEIMDPKILDQVDGALVAFKLSSLYQQPVCNRFDVSSYLAIHKYLFDSIYLFAGEIRTENIQKSNAPYFNSVTPFCRPEFIYSYLETTLLSMGKESKTWQNEEEMINRLAYYYAEINVIHPFREGNGRTQREFLGNLSLP